MVSRFTLQKKYLLAFFVGLIFAWSASRWIDPDFGWHYRLGQIITFSGIPSNNPFSYTMPSYPFVDHEWFINVLYFKLYELAGYQTLGVLHALAAIAAPLLALSTQAKSKYWFVPFVLVLTCFTLRFGIRPQVFSWFFMGVFVKIFYDQRRWDKLKWFFPPLMLIWANFHGGYPLAIGLATILIALRSYKAKRVVFSDFIVIVASTAATLVNPYGPHLWEEIINQMKLTRLYGATIGEWKPSLFTFDVGFFALYSFTFVLFWTNRKRLELWEVVIFIGGLTAGISSGCHTPFSVLLISPLFVKYFELLAQKAKKVYLGNKRIESFYSLLIVVGIVMFLFGSWSANRGFSKFREGEFYNDKAVRFLESYSREPKNIFADYSIGGYLIWKLPLNKYFVDGRMPGFVYDAAPEGESNNAYREYLDTICGNTELSDSLNKYRADVVIASKNTNKDDNNFINKKPAELLFNAGLLYCKNPVSIPNEMQKLDWKKIYEDDKDIIYER